MRIQSEPVGPGEIARAIKQARAIFAYGTENITNQAFWLGYAEMFASYGWFESYVHKLAAVRAADVRRVAQTYLQPGAVSSACMSQLQMGQAYERASGTAYGNPRIAAGARKHSS